MLEWEIQHYVVRELHKRGVLYHGDQNSGKRGYKAQMQSKATGMRSGWPDLTIVLSERIVFIEFKRGKVSVSKEQKEVHGELKTLGFEVYVIRADTGEDAWKEIYDIIEDSL